MKTKWRLCILWSVISFGLLGFCCAADTHESRSGRRKTLLKLAKSVPNEQSSEAGDRGFFFQSLPGSTSASAPAVTPPDAKISSGFAHLPDVSVSCSASDLVVRVKPTFYGQGADAEELTLGSACKSNGVLRPYGDILFTYPLTACDAVRQVVDSYELPYGYLVYKFVLHYAPSPKRSQSTTQRMDVDIECRYQRSHHVYQLTVKPTWETAILHKKLKGSSYDFQFEQMDDSWSGPDESDVYQLGQSINLQVSTPYLPAGEKLYISSCYATPVRVSQSTLKYTIIDNFGCMLDGKGDPGASKFISRTDNAIRFSLKAFQFTSDPDTEVNIHCKVLVTSEGPCPAYKSCTYRGHRWEALTGEDSICECCNSHCVTAKPHRAMMEGSARSGSLLVSGQLYAEGESLPVGMIGQGEATIHHDTDEMDSDENLRENEDVHDDHGHIDEYDDDEDEEQFYDAALDKPSFRERMFVEGKKGPDVEEEDRSGYAGQEGVSESEDEGFVGERELSEVEPITRLNQKLNVGREWKRINKEDSEDDEMTWYFTWM